MLTAPDLPPGASIHVVLIYPRGDRAAAQQGLDRRGCYGPGGSMPAIRFRSGGAKSKRGISYYFAQDEDAAGKIGRRLGGGYGSGRLVRLSPSAGLPRPGTIEIAVGSD